MKAKIFNVLDAALPAAFVATITGICFSGADYILIHEAEEFLERIGLLPTGWGAAHATPLNIAVAATTLAVTVYVAWWTYRMARKSQAQDTVQC